MNCTGKRCIMQYDKVDPPTCECVKYCPEATPPKTNADRIRAMSDEELADFLDTDVMNCVSVALHDDSYECPDDPCECTECWLRWLKEEAKE